MRLADEAADASALPLFILVRSGQDIGNESPYFYTYSGILMRKWTNCTSRLFSQVLKQHLIKHNLFSAYHPESQGALERYHQTYPSSYCLELGQKWDEGIPWLIASHNFSKETGWQLPFLH